MARSHRIRTARVASHVLTGAVLFTALAWALHAAALGLIHVEDAISQLWFAVYLHVGWATAALLVVIAVLAALHLWRHGRDDVRPRGPGDQVRWWSLAERAAHWTLVLSFVVLLVTGVELYYAGPGLPSPLTRTMRQWHFGEAFMGLGFVLFVLWHRDAMPRRYDLRWLAHLGGYLHRGEPLPAGRFNAGQKLWFWLEAAGGFVMAVTGYELQYHYTRFDDGYLTLLALHLAAGALFLAVLAVHFYLAVVGVRGALAGMVRGVIGRQGARRLHSEAPALKGSEAE